MSCLDSRYRFRKRHDVLLANVAADEEEAGANIVAGEDLEKALRDDIVGAVIEGEGDFVWIIAGNEGLAKQLGFRR